MDILIVQANPNTNAPRRSLYAFVESDNGEVNPVGLLKADKAIVFNTLSTFKDRDREI